MTNWPHPGDLNRRHAEIPLANPWVQGRRPTRQDLRELVILPTRLVHPVTVAVLGIVLTILPPALASPSAQRRWGAVWYLDGSDYAILAAASCMVLGGAWIGSQTTRKVASNRVVTVDAVTLQRASQVLSLLFAVGYVVWTASAVLHGLSFGLIVASIQGSPGASYAAKDAAEHTVPGISTLTQVAPVLVAVLLLLWRIGIRRPVLLTSVYAITMVRMFVNSERLSLIEIGIPTVVILLLTGRSTDMAKSVRANFTMRMVAVSSPVLVFLLFALNERGRSWNSFYKGVWTNNLLVFTADRIDAYYATATNNGAIWEKFVAPLQTWPSITLQILTSFPILGKALTALGIVDQSDNWLRTLDIYANPEFNNTGSILPIVGEVGLVLGLLTFWFWGWVPARLYAAGIGGNVAALCGFSTLTIGLVELSRVAYYTGSRVVPVVGALLLVAYICRPRDAAPEELHDADLQLDHAQHRLTEPT